MPRIYKEVEIPATPATKKQRLDYIACSFCGKHTIMTDREDAANWNKTCPQYEYKLVTIKLTEETRYPEGGGAEGIFWDICPKCFEEKVRPHLPEIYEKFKLNW